MLRPILFEPVRIGTLDLANRIAIAPICQYAAEDGCMNDWHLIQLGQLALSGAALLTIETTAVLPEGRTSHADVGLWNVQNEAAMGLTIESIRRWSDMPLAVQLSHAGRRASVEVPSRGGAQMPPGDGHGWQTRAPSALARRQGDISPRALDRRDIKRIRGGFTAAARRAANIGIDAIQLQAASGHLLHQFLSPLSNQRTDEYGGSLANRMRFPLEVLDAIRDEVCVMSAERCTVTVRMPATDWLDGGWDLAQATAFAHELARHGCDAIHIAGGGLLDDAGIPAAPGYQVPFARALRHETGVPVIAAGWIMGFEQAEAIVCNGDADVIAIGHAIIENPQWPRHAALRLCGPAPGETMPSPGAPWAQWRPRAMPHEWE